MARLIGCFGHDRRRLLDITAGAGLQTLAFRDRLERPEVPVIYDWCDLRHPTVVPHTTFQHVDLERGAFPAATGSFGVVVWHLNLVTLKNAVTALSEAVRVIEPGGLFVLSLPNLAALHNRVLLGVGCQPTTLHIDGGDHVRGFAPRSMSAYLRARTDARLVAVRAIGMPPVSAARVPRPLRNLGHTLIWVLRKEGAGKAGAPQAQPEAGPATGAFPVPLR